MNQPLIYAHIGDLHITNAKERNYRDFLAIVSQLAVQCKDQLDFVLLPGDNADNGLPQQYQLIAAALKMLDVPVYILTGDHDMEQGGLDNFYRYLPAQKLPFRVRVKGVNCLFLDVCGPGSGGPDFRLGRQQSDDLEEVLAACRDGDSGACALFMHTYPDDLKDPGEKKRLLQQIIAHRIALVDMGHTHYNELANSGTTVYAATRSTGQIEEGPVGYSIASLDQGVVSWRFKALDDPFPFVLITQPADYRLIRSVNEVSGGEVMLRATVLGAYPIEHVRCTLENGEIFPMDFDGDRVDWFTVIPFSDEPIMKVVVEAVTTEGRPGRHMIEIATSLFQQKTKGQDGSDEQSIGAWPENGILGTRLGPNRNAKPAGKKKS